MIRLLLTCIVALAVFGCAPSALYVRDHVVEAKLEDGFEQGPVRMQIPLHESLPTQVKVSITSRCAPRFQAMLGEQGLSPAFRWMGDSPAELRWQRRLQSRVERNQPAAAPEAPPAQPTLQVLPTTAHAEVSNAGVVAGAQVGVTLPGHWREVESDEARWLREFQRAEQEICAEVSTYELESDPIDPGTRDAELVLWSEWPQLVKDGRVEIEVIRLEPPPPPEEHATPPAPGATWQSGRYVWVHDGAVQRYARWRWEEGRWLSPPHDARPPPRDDRPWFDFGRPSDDARWVNGHWAWSQGGWEWRRGWWSVPVRPKRHAPVAVAVAAPVRAQTIATAPSPQPSAQSPAPKPTPPTPPTPTPPPPEPCDDGPPPEPRAEVQPEAPSPDAHWIGGSWRRDGCRWAWRAGHFEVPPGPNYLWVPGPSLGIGGQWVLTPH